MNANWVRDTGSTIYILHVSRPTQLTLAAGSGYDVDTIDLYPGTKENGGLHSDNWDPE